MKLCETLLLLLGLDFMFCTATNENYKTDFEIFRSYDGPKSESISPDANLNKTEPFYDYFGPKFEPKSPDFDLNKTEPFNEFFEPSFFDSFSEQSRSDKLFVREKREEPTEYDYSKAYQEFVKENFGVIDGKSFASDEDEEESEADEDENYERIKKISEKSKRNKKPCKTTYRDGKECTVCKNPKTNAESESCSYSSAPTPKKYAYKRERNYNSKDDSDRDADDYGDYDQHSKTKTPTHHRQEKFLARRGDEYIPVQAKKIKILHPDQKGRYYPYLAGNVDKVLEDFKAKDWSKCRRKIKNGITCYYCKDQFGAHNEECVYASDSSREGNREAKATTKRPNEALRLSLNPEDDDEQHEPIKKRTIKRMVSMKINAPTDGNPIDRKSFLYAKSVIHFTK